MWSKELSVYVDPSDENLDTWLLRAVMFFGAIVLLHIAAPEIGKARDKS